MKKKILILIILAVNIGIVNSADSEADLRKTVTTIIFVRHAEKVIEVNRDPALTKKGRERAQELAYILEYLEIDQIYSTPFIRTKATVTPLAKDKKLQIIPYKSKNEQKFLSEILREHKGKTILISGHSNTIPIMVNILMGKKLVSSLGDNIYDNLFILQVQSIGNAIVTRLRFGSHTAEK